MAEPVTSPSLNRSKRYATVALVVAVVARWLILIAMAKLVPEYARLIQILMLAAEAGVVGGLADWYAITVLFRNPFGRIPIPAFLKPYGNHSTQQGSDCRIYGPLCTGKLPVSISGRTQSARY